MATENIESRLVRVETMPEQHEKRIASSDSQFEALREDIRELRTIVLSTERSLFWRLFLTIIGVAIPIILAIIFAP